MSITAVPNTSALISDNSGFPREVMDLIATAVLLIEPDWRVTALNMAAENLLEVSASRALGEQLSGLMLVDDDWSALLGQAQSEGFPVVRRGIELNLRNGQSQTVDAVLTPIQQQAHGQVLLEISVVDRLNAISEDDSLWQSQATLRKLINGLAHEVKNPLGGIRGAAQLLAKELPDAALAEYTDIIMQEADRLRALVDRMLGPREQLKVATVNIHEVIERVRQLIEAEAHQQITITRDYDPSLPDLQADAAQLTQLLLNIVRNAWQAAGAGMSITLRTRARRQYTLGRHKHRLVCAIEIIDNGPGVPEDILPGLFLPMVTGRADGTGLGLSISQMIANRHGGLIQCDSQPGHTVFTVLLPMET